MHPILAHLSIELLHWGLLHTLNQLLLPVLVMQVTGGMDKTFKAELTLPLDTDTDLVSALPIVVDWWHGETKFCMGGLQNITKKLPVERMIQDTSGHKQWFKID